MQLCMSAKCKLFSLNEQNSRTAEQQNSRTAEQQGLQSFFLNRWWGCGCFCILFLCVGFLVLFIRGQFDHQDIDQRSTRTPQMTWWGLCSPCSNQVLMGSPSTKVQVQTRQTEPCSSLMDVGCVDVGSSVGRPWRGLRFQISRWSRPRRTTRHFRTHWIDLSGMSPGSSRPGPTLPWGRHKCVQSGEPWLMGPPHWSVHRPVGVVLHGSVGWRRGRYPVQSR